MRVGRVVDGSGGSNRLDSERRGTERDTDKERKWKGERVKR